MKIGLLGLLLFNIGSTFGVELKDSRDYTKIDYHSSKNKYLIENGEKSLDANKCDEGCWLFCDSDCTLGCDSSCTLSCDDSCTLGCDSGCDPCFGSCDGDPCFGSCDGDPCFGSCDGDPCFGSCDGCWGICGCDSSCTFSCDSSCTLSCDSSCTTGCDSDCVACFSSCDDDPCFGSCDGDPCFGSCDDQPCFGSCDGGCIGSCDCIGTGLMDNYYNAVADIITSIVDVATSAVSLATSMVDCIDSQMTQEYELYLQTNKFRGNTYDKYFEDNSDELQDTKDSLEFKKMISYMKSKQRFIKTLEDAGLTYNDWRRAMLNEHLSEEEQKQLGYYEYLQKDNALIPYGSTSTCLSAIESFGAAVWDIFVTAFQALVCNGITFSIGLSASIVGITGSVEGGIALGPNAELGIFLSWDAGFDLFLSTGGGAYACLGMVEDYGGIDGDGFTLSSSIDGFPFSLAVDWDSSELSICGYSGSIEVGVSCCSPISLAGTYGETYLYDITQYFSDIASKAMMMNKDSKLAEKKFITKLTYDKHYKPKQLSYPQLYEYLDLKAMYKEIMNAQYNSPAVLIEQEANSLTNTQLILVASIGVLLFGIIAYILVSRKCKNHKYISIPSANEQNPLISQQ